MAQRDPPAKQQDRAPARNARSPGRRVYNSRLLATRSHIIATNPHMSTAEASRLALNTLGHYVPSSQAAASQQSAAAATPATAEAAHQVSARKGLMAPMTEITNTQDKVPMPASARKAVEARLAKGGSSTAISGHRRYTSHTQDQLAQDSACPQPPQQLFKANMLHPQLQASNLQLQQQAMHPEKAQTEQTAVSDAAKGDADKQDWSAQLRAACHTLGLEHVTDLDAAKDEMTRALVYLRSIEHSLRGLKRQTEAVTGSLGLEWYLLREQKYIQSDIEAECARIATLACLIKNLERGTKSN